MPAGRRLHRSSTAARLSGWRALVARGAALLLLLGALVPMPVFAGIAAAELGLVYCTTDGPTHVAPVAASADAEGPGRSTAPAGHVHDNCPICRIAGATPILPPPDTVVVLPLPPDIVAAFAVLESDAPPPPLPRGSLAARAPPRSI